MKSSLLIALLISFFAFDTSVLAQDTFSLSVTPTFFEITAAPNEAWDDSVTVVNSNDYPITVYVSLAKLAPTGEFGAAQYEPVDHETATGPASWFTLPDSSTTIPPEQSIELPFSVRIPPDPAPGGSYFALMVGTEPPEEQVAAYQVRTSQVVSTLVFMKIAGDVVESGQIRSLQVRDQFVMTPENTFSLRFENNGTVHLRPRGEIIIKNMWGSERGSIAINDSGQFGNVLPNSIRTFRYEWSAEPHWTDFGLYTAEAVVGYGSADRQFSSREATFLVIPLLRIVLVLTLVAGLLGIIIWSVKTYVRRMLRMSGLHPERIGRFQAKDSSERPVKRAATANDLVVGTDRNPAYTRSAKVKLLIGSVALAVLFVLFWFYVGGVTEADRSFETAPVPPPANAR